MKINPNKPALVLDFTSLKGSGREALSSTLQRFLVQKLGFHWESEPTGSRPMHTKADAIIVNSGDGCPVSLRHIREGQLEQKPQANSEYFNAATQHDEFLNALEDLLPKNLSDCLDLIGRTLQDIAKRPNADESSSARV